MPQAENFVGTGSFRHLRACMVCSIVMTGARFRSEGCPNCEEILQLRGSADQVDSCTSQVFDGLVALSRPERSWVARWQHLAGCVPGVYAVKVSGALPDDIKAHVEEETGQKVVVRDGTDVDDGQE